MKKVSEYDLEYHNRTLQTNPDKTKICLGIDPALLVSKLWTLCIAITTWPATTDPDGQSSQLLIFNVLGIA